MKQLSFKKLSLLGLVLIAASAVTAAVIPSKVSTSVKNEQNGHLTASTDSDQTCRAGGVSINCYNTTGNDCSTSSTMGTERDNDSSDEEGPENTTVEDYGTICDALSITGQL